MVRGDVGGCIFCPDSGRPIESLSDRDVYCITQGIRARACALDLKLR